jgi:hypothetical protein
VRRFRLLNVIDDSFIIMQTTLERFYKNKKPVFSLQDLSMARVPKNVKLPHGLTKLSKVCGKCKKNFLVKDPVNNLCIKCRICGGCGLDGKTMRKKCIIDDVYKLYYMQEPKYWCSQCTEPWSKCTYPWYRKSWCECCRAFVSFVYPVKVYCDLVETDNPRINTSEKCANCIYAQECYECKVKYTNMYDINSDYIYNLDFITILHEKFVEKPPCRIVCEDCFNK